MEAEARVILRDALLDSPASESDNLAKRIRSRMAPLGGVEFDLPKRRPSDREPPTFD